MPQSRGNSGPAGKGEKWNLELSHIVGLLRFIAAMTGALLVISLLFFFLSEKTEADNVVYSITILVNLIAFLGSSLGAWKLDKKDEKLTERERKLSSSKKEGAQENGK